MAGKYIIGVVRTSVPGRIDAERLADDLIEQRLASCVNILDNCWSKFWWNGRVNSESEVYCIIKTSPEKIDSIIDYLEAHHPYEVPCIVIDRACETAKPFHDYSADLLGE